MKRILIVHTDEMFAEFLVDYLNASGFYVKYSTNNVEGYKIAVKMKPDLLILSKESEYLDLKGFLIRKRMNETIADTPIFLVGNFLANEISFYQKQNVAAFLSKKLNPRALVERIVLFFNLSQRKSELKTPMVMDIHSKGNVIVVQIEGNFDAVQLVMLNFLLRLFCRKMKIISPHILYIVPSIYPETITDSNIDYLFAVTGFREIKVKPEKIQILSNVKQFRDLVSEHKVYGEFTFAKDYVEAFRELISDIDIETKIPLSFLKPGSVFSLDLYDLYGRMVLTAGSPMTKEHLQEFKEKKMTHLKYYSDVDITQVELVEGMNMNAAIFDYICREFMPISTESFDMNVMQQKQNLFFSNVRGQKMIVISKDQNIYNLVQQILGQYYEITRETGNNETVKNISEDHISIAIIDMRDNESNGVSMIAAIRQVATRRKTTVILLTDKINKLQLAEYSRSGTDHVILFPVTSNKIYDKVYSSVLEDRGN